MKERNAMKTIGTALITAIAIVAIGAASTAAVAQNELRIGRTTDVLSLDAGAMADTLSEWAVIDSIYSGLVTFIEGSWKVGPDLAESWEVSDDGLAITFKLREGVQFHKGYGEVTAEDVKFSFERIIDPTLEAAYAVKWEALDYVEVVDKYTARIHLKELYAPLFAATLAYSAGQIVSKKAVEEMGREEFSRNPIGSGPYEFVEWVPNDHVTLKRFDGYSGDRPSVDKVTFVPITDVSTVEAALKAGELDIGRINLINVKQHEANSDLNVVIVPGTRYYWLPLNHSRPPFDNILLRKAFRSALDVDEILIAMFDGRAERSDSNFLPSVLGYWGAPLFQQDIPAAKALLAEAGYPDGFEMEIVSISDNIYVSGSEVMQAQLAEAGIKAKIIVVESAAATDLSLAGKYDTRIANWTAVSDPHIYVTYYKTGEKWNYPHWSNSEFDNAVNAGGVETNQKARADYYTKAQQIWDAEIAGVPLTHGINAMASRQGVDLGTLYPGGELAIWTMSKN